jgi:hypothetical protein
VDPQNWTFGGLKAEAPNDIDPVALLNKHRNIFISFYDWLLNRFQDIHATEFELLQYNTSELRRILEPIPRQP